MGVTGNANIDLAFHLIILLFRSLDPLTTRLLKRLIMKTIYARRIRSIALLMAISFALSVGVAVGLHYLNPMLWALIHKLSPSGYETMFNTIFLALPLVFSFFFLGLYPFFVSKYSGPLNYEIKYLAPLGGALLLIICAWELYSLYSDLYDDGFANMCCLTPEEEGVKARLRKNLSALRYIVPGVMLGVASSLITLFLHSEKLNSDKSPND